MHEEGDESVERMDEDTPQDAAPGAAVDDQGVGQHDDQDATDVDSKQDHPATPSDMGSR
ncbi:MAG: hypothetical protein QOJ89_2629 [bacterium]|jgi:hypothetical protein